MTLKQKTEEKGILGRLIYRLKTFLMSIRNAIRNIDLFYRAMDKLTRAVHNGIHSNSCNNAKED